jgi:hypothetical protein
MNVGHKRSLTSVYAYLKEQGYDTDLLRERINDMFIKAFISGHPVLSSTYRSCQPNNFSNNMCFELLGFDVIIDSKFNPILLEVCSEVDAGQLYAELLNRHTSGQPYKKERNSRCAYHFEHQRKIQARTQK